MKSFFKESGLRGGNFNSIAGDARVADRYNDYGAPTDQYNGVGFRCAR